VSPLEAHQSLWAHGPIEASRPSAKTECLANTRPSNVPLEDEPLTGRSLITD